MSEYKVRMYYTEPREVEYSVSAPNPTEALGRACRLFEVDYKGCHLKATNWELVPETVAAPEEKSKGRKPKK